MKKINVLRLEENEFVIEGTNLSTMDKYRLKGQSFQTFEDAQHRCDELNRDDQEE